MIARRLRAFLPLAPLGRRVLPKLVCFRRLYSRGGGGRGNLLVATHNIMDGLFLNDLLKYYKGLSCRAENASLVLCVQENISWGENLRDDAAGRIADVLQQASADSSSYEIVRSSTAPRFATIFDSNRLKLLESATVELPVLSKLPFWNKLVGLSLEQKHALSCSFQDAEDEKGGVYRVHNFHLDAAGNNAHRLRQFGYLVSHINAGKVFAGSNGEGDDQDIFCGDSNLFSFLKSTQIANLKKLAELMGAGGALVGDPMIPTHFFSRANEPKFGHQVVYNVGKLGVDFPRCYDVLLTSMDVNDWGVLDTKESDHNLVFGEFETGRPGQKEQIHFRGT